MQTLLRTRGRNSTELQRRERSIRTERRFEQRSGSEKVGADTSILSLYLSRARRHRLLSREEEAALSQRIRHQGDQSAWEELVQCNLRLVVSIARRYVGQGLELVDLVQEGNLGLMRAAHGFDAAFGTKFSTYATWWIKQAIRRAVSNKASVIRLPVHAADEERALNEARNYLQATTGRDPSLDELSEFVGKSMREVADVLNARKRVVSYDVPIGSEEEGTLSEFLSDEGESNAEELYMEDALKDSVQDLLARLPERERRVVELRYGLDGSGRYTTLEEIGEEIGVTRERVRQVQNVALRRLRSMALEARLDSFLEPSLDPP